MNKVKIESMKYFFILGLILFFKPAYAAHILGGQIWYEFVSTNGGYDTYKVHLDLYRDGSTTIGTGTQQTINIKSIAGGTTVVNTTALVYLSKPEYVWQNPNCFANSYDIRISEFENTFVLPSNSSTTFHWNVCCRPNYITSIPSSQTVGLYLEAKLNLENQNIRSYENSVKPIPIGLISLLQGVPNQIATPHSEIDGDSVYATLKSTKQYDFGSSQGINIVYASGYTFLDPIHSDSIFPFSLDSQLSGISALPTTLETSVISIRVDNYVMDTSTNQPFRIGYVNIDIPIVVSTLNTTANTSPLVLSNIQSINSQTVDLVFSEPVYTNSISQNLSEFEITNQFGTPLSAISGLQPLSNVFGLADTLRITLDSNTISGKYPLQIQKGDDSTTLVGQCGKSLSDTTFVVKIPFPQAFISGNLNPYVTGFYRLSNFGNIDSILWKSSDATIQISGNQLSTYISGPSDSVEIRCTASPAHVQAIRYGHLDTDTLNAILLPTGIGFEALRSFKFSVSPNPSSGQFIVETPVSYLGYQYTIIDGLGRLIKTGVLENHKSSYQMPKGYSGIIYFIVKSNERAIVSCEQINVINNE